MWTAQRRPEHQGVDGDDHVAAPHQRRGGGPAVIVTFVVGGQGRVVVAEVDHLLLAEQEQATVRVQIDNRRGGPLEQLGDQDVGRHAGVGRGGEDELFAEVVAPVDALQDLRPGIDLLGPVEEQFKDLGPGGGPVFLVGAEAAAGEGEGGAVALRQPGHLGEQAAQVGAGRLQVARRVGGWRGRSRLGAWRRGAAQRGQPRSGQEGATGWGRVRHGCPLVGARLPR